MDRADGVMTAMWSMVRVSSARRTWASRVSVRKRFFSAITPASSFKLPAASEMKKSISRATLVAIA
jgi:hypothetical protein